MGYGTRRKVRPSKPKASVSNELWKHFQTLDLRTVGDALQVLDAADVQQGVRGCASLEACSGWAGEGLFKIQFDGCEEYSYCFSCCDRLRVEYSGLKRKLRKV